MSKIDAVLITINTLNRIPFLNRIGPILSPMSVTRSTAENLQKIGFPVKYHDDRVITENDDIALTILDVRDDKIEAAEEKASEDPILPNPSSPPESLAVQEPTEIESVELEEEEEDLGETDEEEEGAEFEVFAIGHYKSWTVKKLVSYLQSASDYLEEEEVASLENLSKTKLLALIEKRLISAVE